LAIKRTGAKRFIPTRNRLEAASLEPRASSELEVPKF